VSVTSVTRYPDFISTACFVLTLFFTPKTSRILRKLHQWFIISNITSWSLNWTIYPKFPPHPFLNRLSWRVVVNAESRSNRSTFLTVLSHKNLYLAQKEQSRVSFVDIGCLSWHNGYTTRTDLSRFFAFQVVSTLQVACYPSILNLEASCGIAPRRIVRFRVSLRISGDGWHAKSHYV